MTTKRLWDLNQGLGLLNKCMTDCTIRGSLKRSARAVQLFGRLAVLETHTLRYQGPLGASW